MTEQNNLNWLHTMLNEKAEAPIVRENFLNITSYGHRELLVSNLLAYYLDEERDHGFSRLFFDSLLDTLQDKGCFGDLNENERNENGVDKNLQLERQLFESAYDVRREAIGQDNKRIDILITGKGDEENDSEEDGDPKSTEWCVIIENKIWAGLYNDLNKYWDSFPSSAKVGVVLSVHRESIKNDRQDFNFVNITHRELINKIIENLPQHFLSSDDRHLILLKEYIENIETFYPNPKMTKAKDTNLHLIQKNQAEIKKLKTMDVQVLTYVSTELFSIMGKHGYPPYTTKATSKAKHFNYQKDGDIQNFMFAKDPALNEEKHLKLEAYAKEFRFWIDIDKLRYENQFWAYFELFGKYSGLASALREALDSNSYNGNVQLVTSGGKNYAHIYRINIVLDGNTEESFKQRLETALVDNLFGKNYIISAITELKKLSDKAQAEASA